MKVLPVFLVTGAICFFLAVLDIDTLGTFNVSKTVYNKFFKVLMIKWII